MVDWNNDGRVDPTEVVLTDIILSEQDDSDLDEEPLYEEQPADNESWLTKLFQRRRRHQK